MKKIFLLFIPLAAVMSACSSKGLDANGIPLPEAELAEMAGITINEMGEGYWVFKRKCVECHQAQIPSGDLVGQWHPQVSGLAGNVGLSPSEETSIVRYLKAAKLQ